ncbi:MAG: cytochrome c3 family protein [Polyangiaceae bacterium]
MKLSAGALLLSFAVFIASVLAFALPQATADTAPTTPSTSASSAPSSSALPVTNTPRGGLAPMPGDAEVPLEWMPPGSQESPVPSDEIFPPQSITIRFNHKKHVGELALSCKSCHTAAYSSLASSDSLLPAPTETCDACHDVDHSDKTKVVAGTAANGQCSFCHLGEHAGEGGRVARTLIPAPNLRFPHKKHLDRNINCVQCHGRIDQLELATRDQLPRMAGCFNCHAMPAPSDGDAKGACTTCHLTQPNGKLQLEFATGSLVPPTWLHLAGHTPDWIDRHKTVAANDTSFCASCHREEDCGECHDGRVRNRTVHPNDWITMHATAAELDNPRCVSCHQLSTFCGDCHRRTGVARDAPIANRPAGAQFHPPRAVWVEAPRSAGHHSWEAQRNLNACVACHAERDCATCHAASRVPGGANINPHPTGFVNKCSVALSRNPRPCLVCHDASSSTLDQCR